MSNESIEHFNKLAKLAGHDTRDTPIRKNRTRKMYFRVSDIPREHGWQWMPGSFDRLEHDEVDTVLSWLSETGYKFSGGVTPETPISTFGYDFTIHFVDGYNRPISHAKENTLRKAVYEAVMKLKL